MNQFNLLFFKLIINIIDLIFLIYYFEFLIITKDPQKIIQKYIIYNINFHVINFLINYNSEIIIMAINSFLIF